MANILVTIFINPLDTKRVTINNLDFIRENYEFFYGGLEVDANSDIIEDTIKIGIRSKYGIETLVNPVFIKQYSSDGVSSYVNMESLLNDLGAIFGVSNSSIIKQVSVNYSSLFAGTVAGDLAYVSESEGTSWLPSNLGGTYYPKGIYFWNGSSWVSDRNAISNQLESNIVGITGLDTRIADLENTWISLVTGFSTKPVVNNTIAAGTVYDYSYTGGLTRYRLVPSPYDATQDAFYANFDGTNLTGIITTRNK